jgi:DNA replication protein
MKPSARHTTYGDFLSTPFVSVPYDLLSSYANLGIHAHEMVMLLQILANGQVHGTTELSAQEVGDLCGMSSKEVLFAVERLVHEGLLGIGERWDDSGAHVTYFDLQPLWERLRGKPTPQEQSKTWRTEPFTMFEEEFGRPLSALECEQLRTWLSQDGYGCPEWMVVEALREAVLANKYSFKYIDRVLFDWQRNQVQSRQDLEQYRQQYRDRIRDTQPKKRNETQSATHQNKRSTERKPQEKATASRDERYANFYQLFPEN